MTSILGCVFLAVVSFVVFVIGCGGMIPYIFDPLAIMIMVFLPFLFQCIFYGKFFATAFTIIGKKEEKKEIWIKAYNFFKNYEQFIWVIAILFLLAQFAIDLIWLETREGLGPHIKFMANLIIVAGLIDLAIVLPYKILIKKQLTQIE
ncbi:MAG: hypothetical protein LBK73_14140 [Treponema sp.]|nr:hypothetical protein [Treponema sp.]